MERWRRQANEDKLNENPELWRLPAFGQVTSTCPRAGLRTQQFVLMLIMVLAVPIGLIGGTDLHRHSLLSTGLAILAVVAGHTFASVPTWRLPVPPYQNR